MVRVSGFCPPVPDAAGAFCRLGLRLVGREKCDVHTGHPWLSATCRAVPPVPRAEARVGGTEWQERTDSIRLATMTWRRHRDAQLSLRLHLHSCQHQGNQNFLNIQCSVLVEWVGSGESPLGSHLSWAQTSYLTCPESRLHSWHY